MTLILTFLILFALLLLGSGLFILDQARTISLHALYIEELLWKRRHKIPLIIELTAPHDELVALRADLSESKEYVEVLTAKEHRLTQLLSDIFRATESTTAPQNMQLLGLKNEITTLSEQIHHAQNDYNYFALRLERYLRYPGMKVVAGLFGVRPQEPLKML